MTLYSVVKLKLNETLQLLIRNGKLQNQDKTITEIKNLLQSKKLGQQKGHNGDSRGDEDHAQT